MTVPGIHPWQLIKKYCYSLFFQGDKVISENVKCFKPVFWSFIHSKLFCETTKLKGLRCLLHTRETEVKFIPERTSYQVGLTDTSSPIKSNKFRFFRFLISLKKLSFSFPSDYFIVPFHDFIIMADEIKNKDKWRNLCVYNKIPPLFTLKNREILLLK